MYSSFGMPGYASSGGCKTRRVFCEGDEKDAEEEEGKDAEEEEEEDDADEEEAEEEEEDNAAWSEIRSFLSSPPWSRRCDTR